MVQRVDPMPAEMDSTEPMHYGKGKVMPSISGRVPHGAKEISFFFVVHPDPTSTEQPTLEMEVLKSNESIAQVPLHLAKTSGPGSIPYLASIQSTSLPAAIMRSSRSSPKVEKPPNVLSRSESKDPSWPQRPRPAAPPRGPATE